MYVSEKHLKWSFLKVECARWGRLVAPQSGTLKWYRSNLPMAAFIFNLFKKCCALTDAFLFLSVQKTFFFQSQLQYIIFSSNCCFWHSYIFESLAPYSADSSLGASLCASLGLQIAQIGAQTLFLCSQCSRKLWTVFLERTVPYAHDWVPANHSHEQCVTAFDYTFRPRTLSRDSAEMRNPHVYHLTAFLCRRKPLYLLQSSNEGI